MKKFFSFSVILLLIITLNVYAQTNDPLPSWNDGPIKKNILDFVATVTDKNNPAYVPPKDRIATFDNDGTLWLEQPVYTQFIFVFDRIKKLAAENPTWKTKPPFSTILSGNKAALVKLTMHDVETLLATTHTGMTVEEFKKIVENWITTAENPRFKKHYTQLIYQPMLEVMQYLRANHFKVYIVTGGGQDFVRAFAEKTYSVAPEEVIGSAGKTQYTYRNKQPVLIKKPEVLLIDDKKGKPEAINLFIGKKPIISFGNSDGDREMLEWTQSNSAKHLMLLVHHDDAKREYAYGADSKIGTFSNSLMAEAKQNDWQVISMKQDWKVIFPA